MRIETTRVNSTPVSTDAAPTRNEAVSAPSAPVSSEQAEKSALRLPGTEQSHTPELAQLEQVVEKMNKAVQIFNQTLQFEVTRSHRIVIRVLDTNTGEVIRQIPPDEFLDNVRRVEDAMGVLIDRRV
jgi:flagellar protein FlaG